MKILDLFSGIGGISLGFHSANYENYDFFKLPCEQEQKSDEFFKSVAFCECESFPQKILKKHFKNIPIFDDVKTLTKEKLKTFGINEIDIIAGGFPCQDLSLSGKKQGLSGERSGLFYEMIRLANELKPKYIFFENVPPLLQKGEIFNEFDKTLHKNGYKYEAFILPAKECGYLHERRRAFVVAYATGVRWLGLAKIWSKNKPKVLWKKPTKKIVSFAANLHHSLKQEPELKAAYERSFEGLRKYDGLSDELHAIKALGNAVVPEVVSIFAKLIKQNELILRDECE